MNRCFMPKCKRKVKFKMILEPLDIPRFSCKKHLGDGAHSLMNLFLFPTDQYLVVEKT